MHLKIIFLGYLYINKLSSVSKSCAASTFMTEDKYTWHFMFKLAPPKTSSHSPSLDKQTHTPTHTHTYTGLTSDGGCLGRSGWGRSGRWQKCWSRSPCRPDPPGQRPSGGTASPVHHYLRQTHTISTSSHVRKTHTISSTNTVSPPHTHV